jgi:protein AATF/BFR2
MSEEVSAAMSSLESLASVLDTIAESFVRKGPDSVADLEAENHDSEVRPFDDWRDDVLDSWSVKIDASTVRPSSGRGSSIALGHAASSKPTAFKAIDTRPSAQIRSILASGKHLERSQRVKGTVAAHGAGKNESTSRIAWHFDDGELYRALLREVIDSGDAPGGGLRYAQLARSGRVRKKFDRRASKGRKLSYAVHEKLVGFLAPVPQPDPGPLDEIVAGLFGGSGH